MIVFLAICAAGSRTVIESCPRDCRWAARGGALSSLSMVFGRVSAFGRGLARSPPLSFVLRRNGRESQSLIVCLSRADVSPAMLEAPPGETDAGQDRGWRGRWVFSPWSTGDRVTQTEPRRRTPPGLPRARRRRDHLCVATGAGIGAASERRFGRVAQASYRCRRIRAATEATRPSGDAVPEAARRLTPSP